ncbi:hypothetical protein DIU31_022510 [Mucilaginibacter rubeus]|uniref:Uncharacterized protein n=2 Tax=Mucilaginibacter rubeus TaxID=2027860 RepID=A0A5C1I7Y7_9SPHI|nr:MULTISPECIES: hypothetical protein [Mucilaginibacter]QEM06151.1 hypothetical protein DIU31_022510 [Mucilaginibacter rubeus]QEM13668.1 hypothetical protein DEO27_027865 [Mucilaginibacter rubeus]QEM18731.1 hypothetical protein DIU38_022735 [Mucilaginibacter gossypii]QTE36274.1 hypothetical protein J3L18_24555 [Mucilaginibacter gossypii]QTE44727.1 hypothetical protein J3L19_04980 [Mucilaginibacter rubeus]
MRKKAVFLLFIFLLNSLVGLGCTLRQSFQDLPHHNDHEVVIHALHNSNHADHFLTEKNNHPVLQNEDEACCQNSTARFNSLAKETPQGNKVSFESPQNIFFPCNPLIVRFTSFLPAIKNSKKVSQWPPSWTMRIAIQRFQI